jgi:tetratricopeptide (TPR) repeat protein
MYCSDCAHTDRKEVAQNFKEQGNEYFKGKRYREALGFYTQGVEAKPDDGRLREALLLNRAACNLELRASARRSLPFP